MANPMAGSTPLSLDEAAEQLDKTPEQVSDLIRRGELAGRKENGEWVVDKTSVNLYRAVWRAQRTAGQSISDEHEPAEEAIE